MARSVFGANLPFSLKDTGLHIVLGKFTRLLWGKGALQGFTTCKNIGCNVYKVQGRVAIVRSNFGGRSAEEGRMQSHSSNRHLSNLLNGENAYNDYVAYVHGDK